MQLEYLKSPFVLGLHGASGVGKDFLAKVMREHTKNTNCIAFASPLKHIASIMFDSDLFMPSGTVKDTPSDLLNGYTPRDVLLELSKVKDKFDPFCFFKSSKEDYDTLREIVPSSSVIFTDCRYSHEFDYMLEIGGIIINIVSPDDKTPVLIPSKNGTYVFVNDHQDQNSTRNFLRFINTILKDNL